MIGTERDIIVDPCVPPAWIETKGEYEASLLPRGLLQTRRPTASPGKVHGDGKTYVLQLVYYVAPATLKEGEIGVEYEEVLELHLHEDLWAWSN